MAFGLARTDLSCRDAVKYRVWPTASVIQGELAGNHNERQQVRCHAQTLNLANIMNHAASGTRFQSEPTIRLRMTSRI